MNGSLLSPALEPLGAAILLAARLGGLLLIAPAFSSRAVPTPIRMAALVALTVALSSSALTVTTGLVVNPLTLLSETVVGFVVGAGAAVFIGAASTAGEWTAVQMGLAGATTVNPLSTESSPVLSNLLSMTALLLLLTVDGHLVMIEAVLATTQLIPIGGAMALEGFRTSMTVLGTSLFVTGLRFAAPVVAVLLVVNVGLGILARTVPQLNLLMLAFPVQIGLGLLALLLGMPLLSGIFGSWPLLFEELLDRTMAPILGAP